MSVCANLYKYIVPTGLRVLALSVFYKYIVPTGLRVLALSVFYKRTACTGLRSQNFFQTHVSTM